MANTPQKRSEQTGCMSMEAFIREQEAKGRVFEAANHSTKPTAYDLPEIIFIVVLSLTLFTLVLLIS